VSALFDVKIYVCIFPDNRKIFNASNTAPWPLNDLKEKAEAGTYGVEATVVREVHVAMCHNHLWRSLGCI